VVGAGYWGTKLIREYLAAQSKGIVRLARVCDSSLMALLADKEEFSIFGDLLTQKVQDLIDDPNISAVHIATPNRTHYDLARMVLEGGKDVLIEKPMTLKSREAYELVDLALSSERVLHVGHIFRYNNALRVARKIMRSKAIGKIRYGRVQWTDYAPIFPDRDIIFDLGPHSIDVLNQLLDAWPTQVSGFARAYRNSKEHPEVAYGITEYPDGVFAHVEMSWLQPGKVREATIIGSEGKLVVDCIAQRVFKGSLDKTEEIPVVANNTIEAEIEHFVDCVAKRSVSSKSGLIGARTVEVLEKMYASMWERPLPIIEPALGESIRTSASPEPLAVIETRQTSGGIGSVFPAGMEHDERMSTLDSKSSSSGSAN
jgi:predicted dehydrogenase